MKIRFSRRIELRCIKILIAEYEGEECTLDMNVTMIFESGQEFDGVEFDLETASDVRIWRKDDLIAFSVPKGSFETVEV